MKSYDYVNETLKGTTTAIQYDAIDNSYKAFKPTDSWYESEEGKMQETLTTLSRSIYQAFDGCVEILCMMEVGDNYGSNLMVQFRLTDSMPDGDEVPSDVQHFRSDVGKAVTEYESLIYRDGFMPSRSVKVWRVSRLAERYGLDVKEILASITDNDLLFRHNLRCMERND